MSRIGQPGHGQVDADLDQAVGADVDTDLTMPSSVIGRPISGSLTPASAVVTCSGVGSGELMPSWYRGRVNATGSRPPAAAQPPGGQEPRTYGDKALAG